MPEQANSPFQYALLRVVPDVERGEFLNAGVVVFARTLGFLAARVSLNRERLAALDPEIDPGPVVERLEALGRVAAGDPEAGPIAHLEPSERFSWLVAPASTVIQPSPVHTGLCRDPESMLEHLFGRLVA
jgi:Protein of unknown function (DUF3037)